MKNFFKVVVIAAYVGMVGCAPKPVPVQWTPTGGSRADATVEIGVIYDPNYEYPLTQPDRMLEMARERCRAWGYADAQLFGQPVERCTSRTIGQWGTVICHEKQAKQMYQCIGRGVLSVPGEDSMNKNIVP